ncbi:MAG: hypothetical protein GY705_16260 [Bacteroidetes bacterium]|nr:hypothetical protein [Bacteroidota bacterium]
MASVSMQPTINKGDRIFVDRSFFSK